MERGCARSSRCALSPRPLRMAATPGSVTGNFPFTEISSKQRPHRSCLRDVGVAESARGRFASPENPG